MLDLVTFTEEILNGKLHFLCSVRGKLISLTHFRSLLHFIEASNVIKSNDLFLYEMQRWAEMGKRNKY